jgi:hypothetical protein
MQTWISCRSVSPEILTHITRHDNVMIGKFHNNFHSQDKTSQYLSINSRLEMFMDCNLILFATG